MDDAPTEVTIRSKDVDLYARATEPESRAAATIVLLSGVGFHSFEYVDLARCLAVAGYASVAFDYRGHGRSGGKRGRWTLADLVADTRAVVDWTIGRESRPVVLFGNSLGAMVSILAANADERIAAVAASNCPARVADFLLTPARRLLFGIAKAIAPALPIRISLNHFYRYDQLIADPEWVGRISNDPLIADARRLSVAAYSSLIDGWDGAHEVQRLSKPILLIQGVRDELQPGEQTDLLFSAANEPKSRVSLDAGHLPNIERPELVAASIAHWLGCSLVGAHSEDAVRGST